jgi:hypothetical protein
MSLHEWHKKASARTPIVLVTKERNVNGLRFPEVVSGGERLPNGQISEPDGSIHRGTARMCIAQRTRNLMTPAELEAALKLFDASPEGLELKASGAPESTRREHGDLWILRELAEHESMPPETELALEVVLAHHAHPKKLAEHKARLFAPKAVAS